MSDQFSEAKEQSIREIARKHLRIGTLQLSLTAVQQAISTDWIAAYLRFKRGGRSEMSRISGS